MSGKEQTAEILLTLMACVENVLKKNGIDEDKAVQLATSTVDDFRHQCGGMSIYVPKGVGLDAIVKHDRIFKDFRGSNHAELAKKYGLSEQRIYQIIKSIQAAEFKRVQPGLF
jgi:Mor family transcriptional regulator